MSTGQVWLTNTLGDYMWSPAGSEVLRVVAPTAGTTTDDYPRSLRIRFFRRAGRKTGISFRS